MKKIIGTIMFIVAIAYAGHIDFNHAKMEEAAATCSNQTEFTMPTYKECIDNQFENVD